MTVVGPSLHAAQMHVTILFVRHVLKKAATAVKHVIMSAATHHLYTVQTTEAFWLTVVPATKHSAIITTCSVQVVVKTCVKAARIRVSMSLSAE